METEAREEKVISEGHLARDPKVEKRGGETRLFSFNGKKKKKKDATWPNKSKQPKRMHVKEKTQQLLHHTEAQST